MKLPISSWKRTLTSLGYRVAGNPGSRRDSRRSLSRGLRRRPEKNSQPDLYQLLEPRQLLSADTLIHVVDRGTDQSFQYNVIGHSVDSFSLQNSTHARGATTSPDGSTLYVIDANKEIHVFDTETDAHLGTWRADGLGNVQGIATDGTHVWIADQSHDRVYFFSHAADNRRDSQSASDQFQLRDDNHRPAGITTDGETIWIVDEADRVFVYNADGDSLGDWQLDHRNGNPTGIAIDPAGETGIWVVDERDDQVYRYAHGRNFQQGYHSASDYFPLNSHNRRAEGIAIAPSVVEPGVPVIDSISDDTGISDSDGLTGDNTLLFSGTGDAGSTVTLIEETIGVMGTGTVDASGDWIVDATSMTFPDGQYSVIATASRGDETSDPAIPFEFTVDTIIPIQPEITGIDTDTGLDNGDGVTGDNTLIFQGTAEVKTEVAISDPLIGALGTTMTDDAGNWWLDATAISLADGVYHFTATSSDLAGNTNQSNVIPVLIDSIAPDIPIIVAVTDDTGIDSTDGITNDSSLSISGLAEAHAIVSVFDPDFGLIGTTSVDSTGVWSLASTNFLDGTYEFSAVAEDIAGNVSGPSDSVSVVVDTVAPLTPTLDLDPLFDTAPIGDQTTDLLVVTLTGVTEPEALVVLATGLGPVDGPIADTVADSNGQFDFEEVMLSPGPNRFYVFASDLAGNVSYLSQTFVNSMTDTDPPIVFAELLDDTGFDNSDTITTNPTLIGNVDDTSPLDYIDFYLFNPSLASEFYVEITDKAVDGEFELSPDFLDDLVGGLLPYGQYYYTVDAGDIFGNSDYYDGEFLYVETDPGDVTPPVVTVELLNDTGTSNTDRQTTDGSLAGTVVDQSPVELKVSIADFFDFYSGIVYEGDVTDLLLSDGSYIIPQSRLELILGQALDVNRYFITVEATDQFNVGQDSFNFFYILQTSPPVITAVVLDTGSSDHDGITNDTTLSIRGTSAPGVEIELIESGLGSLGTTTAGSNGEWTFSLPGPSLVDGEYEFIGFAFASGISSDASNVFPVTVDTESPLRARFDLAPDFDTGVVGDSYTTTGLVTLSGTSAPHAPVRLRGSDQSTIADAEGNFRLVNVQLDLGRRIYEIITADVAGNETVSRKSIAYDQPITLTDLAFVTEATQLIDLGQNIGVRTVSFQIDAVFGDSSSGLQDSFAVYLVDPDEESRTLLDRGIPGTSLFSLIGERADYVPGQVRFDGKVVEIDVSSVDDVSEGMLLFQLIDNDNNLSTTVSIKNIGSLVDESGTSGPVMARGTALSPGFPFDVSELTANSALALLHENIRYDQVTNRYIAEIRVSNEGPDLGRSIAVKFDNLPSDVTVLNASGFDANGDPYVSFRESLPTYGLLAGQISDPVRVEFFAPTVSPFADSPVIADGGANSAPVLDPIGTINVTPGDVIRIDLSATDADGQGFYYAINSDGNLPNTTLTANGQLLIAPTPAQIGNYVFEILATDGILASAQPVTINVVADPVTTTRISGWVMDTNSVPLEGIPVELGGTSVLTGSDGAFELAFAGALPGDTLKVHGESYAGTEVFPFIAEKLPLLYGHDAYENVNNYIERPIYLPALDVANGVTIDPTVDVTVTTPTISNASVFVAAGTLETQGGGPFTGKLSITEVPADFTPAALPADQFPDMVVTIQPGEMVFTTPAPLNLPNLAGYFPGTEMTLWSINPNTGLFDAVGVGVVNADGSTIETVSGGINNSSWHFFGVAGPVIQDPNSNPRNLDNECNDCEETDSPNDDTRPRGNGAPGQNDIPLDTRSMGNIADVLLDPYLHNPSPAAGSGGRGTTGLRIGGLDGGWGTGGSTTLPGSADFGPYGSWGGGGGANVSFGDIGTASNVTPSNNPLLVGNDRNANNTEVALHSGAVYKRHDLVPYQSLGSWHGLTLNYDSQRADARPIISTGFDNLQNNFPDPTLTTKLSFRRGNQVVELPGFVGTEPGLTGGEHFFRIPPGATSLDVAIQADLRNMPTGIYEYESTNRFAGNASGTFTGTASVAKDRLVHVNTISSPFGAGWGIGGLLEIVENPDGSALLIDGNGAELVFETPVIHGEAYDSPAGDFSTLVKLDDGRFQRTHIDQTVELFSGTHKLASVTDRNGNVTQFQYDGNDNLELIVDPVGLTTILRYTDGLATEIEDPAGRVTVLTYEDGNLVRIQDPDSSVRQFSYDSLNRLTGELDKLTHNESLRYGFSGRIESIERKDGTTINYSPVQTQGLQRPDLTNNLASQVTASDFGDVATGLKMDANGNVTKFELDKQGQMTEATDAEGDLQQVARNNENLVERMIDGRGNLTIIKYDERGNVISISDVISRGTTTDPMFSDPIYPAAQYTDEIATADFNGDGFADLISENGTVGDSVSLQLGNGAGGFSIGTTYDIVDPVSIQAADVNNDGNFDVVTVNMNDHVSVLLGNGDGTLQDAAAFGTGVSPHKVLTADLNRDGFVDLVTTDRGGDTISVLLGDGTGQFDSFSSFAVADSPRAMAIADINNDQLLDIVVGNDGVADGVSILIGNGDGGFEPATFITTTAETEFIVLADVTGDGNIDVVTGDSDLVVLPGLGDGTFGQAEVTETGSTPSAIKSVQAIAVDADLDGDLELVFADSSVTEMLVFENDGSGAFSLRQTIATGGRSLLAVDVNFDGIDDLVTIDENIISVTGSGDGTFVEPPPPSNNNILVGDGPSSLAVADFNNDGNQDIVVGAQFDNTITTLLGAGDGTLTPQTPIVSAGLVIAVAASDLNGDGNVDLVTAHFDSNTVEVRYGNGTGEFEEPISFAFPGRGPREVKVGDFNNDSILDIVTIGHQGASDPGFAIAYGNEDGSFSVGPLIVAIYQAGTIDVGDIDADGNLDVVVGVSYFSYGNAARPYLGNGDGTFVDQGNLPFGGGTFAGPPKQLRLVDLNNDGILDIAGVDDAQNSLKVLNGRGNGTFESAVSYAMDAGPRSIDIGDINGDGLSDVIATNFNSDRISIFFGKTDGTLTARQDFAVGLGPYAVKLVDLDEDGALDFVTANVVADAVSIRINTTDVTNQAAQIIEYDPGYSQISRSIDEEGRVVVFEIDPTNGNTLSRTQVIGPVGGGDDIVTSYTYLPNGLVNTITDPLGRVTDMSYNARGLLERITFALGTIDEASISYEYDAAGNHTAIIDELAHRSEYVYDVLNRITRVIKADPDGTGPLVSPVSMMEYDDQGNLTRATDALFNTTQYIYDEQHRLIETIDANLESIKHEYDQSGNLTTTTDRLDRRTEFLYDQRGRLVETIDAEGGRAINLHDEDDNIVATIDENGIFSTYVFDARNRLVRSTNALGNTIRYQFDRANNLIAITDELGRRTAWTHDELNRVVAVTLPDPDKSGPNLAPVTTTQYDDASNAILTTDALGNITARAYDERNRLVQTTEADPDGAGPLGSPVWINQYDDAGRLIRSLDPLERETSYVYDNLNRLVIETLPDPDGAGPESAPQMTYTYDAVYNRRTKTDALGNTTIFEYDDLYRVVMTVDPDPDGAGPLLSPVTSIVFDAEGQMERVVDPLGRTTVFTYDLLGRVATETRPDPDADGPDSSPVFTYQYDGVGNEVLATDALGNVTRYLYDDLYRLVNVIEPDPDGEAGLAASPTTVMTYDAAHQLVSTTDPLNRTTSFEYDDLGRVIRATYPDPDADGPDAAPTIRYVYDLMGNELSMTDAIGNTTSNEYDHLYRLIKTTEADPDAAGPLPSPVTVYDYDIAGQLISVSDPLNRTTEYEYDGLGRVIRETFPDPDGAGPDASPKLTYVYDLMNNQLSMTDALSNTTSYAYDNLYRLISTTKPDPDGEGPELNPVTAYTYDVASQLTTITDALGRITSMQYDDLGRVVRQTEPDPDAAGPFAAPITTFDYDVMNNRLSVTDALGNTTAYEYDKLYRLTKITQADPDGTGPQSKPTTTMSYDVVGQLTSTTDPLGRVSSYVYDNLGRVVLEAYPDPDGAGPLTAPEMSHVFDLMNHRLSMTDAAGNITQYAYDDLYRLIRITESDPDGDGPLANPITQFSYDIAGQLISTTDPLNRTTTNQYDDLGRVIRRRQPDPDGAGPLAAPEMGYVYDLMNNTLSLTNPLGHVTEYEYDDLFRVIRELGEDLDGPGPLANPTTEYAYDLVDNLISLRDSSGNVTQYSYDDLDRLSEETIELGTGNFASRRFEYDLEDNLIRRTDRNDRVIELDHDAIYRMTEERWLDPTGNLINAIQFDFDEASQILRAEDLMNGSRYDYSYDNLGRATRSVVDNGGPEVVFETSYDAQSRRVSRTASIGGVGDYRNVYNYDGLNRLTRLDQAGQLDGNAVSDKRIDFGYNADDQLTIISRHDDVSGGESNRVMQSNFTYDEIGRLEDLTHASAAATIVEFDWTYDAASRIIQFTNSVDGDSEFTYDNTDQLTGATHAAQADETYEFDEDGNRISGGYSTGYYNRLNSDGVYSYQYDAEGNRTQRTSIATSAVTEYDWDHRNRLVLVTDRVNEGGAVTQTVNHRYDVFNRWISKTVDDVGEEFVAPVTTRYEYDGNQIVLAMDASGLVTNRYLWGPGADQLLADEQIGDQVYWTATDHLGTIRDVIDSSGNVVNHILYDSFGNVVGETNSEVQRLFGFTGRPLDESTGLQNNLNRWYDAGAGRWLNEDPISFQAGDVNLYRYVGNGSVNATDPEGLDWLDRAAALGYRFNQQLARNLTSVGTSVGETANVIAAATIAGGNQIIGREKAAEQWLGHAKTVHKNSEFMNNPRTVAAGRTALMGTNGLTLGYGVADEAARIQQEAILDNDIRSQIIYGLSKTAGSAVTILGGFRMAGAAGEWLGGSSVGQAVSSAYNGSAYAQSAASYTFSSGALSLAAANFSAANASYQKGNYVDAIYQGAFGIADLVGAWIARPRNSRAVPCPIEGGGLSRTKIREIQLIQKGNRPHPSTYMSRSQIERQLSKFDNGASRFTTQRNLNKYGPGQTDGTTFVMPKQEADEIVRVSGGDPRKMESALGLSKHSLDTHVLNRVDFSRPRNLNVRIPSGNEAGANSFWVPGGRLPNGSLEAVIDVGGIPSTGMNITTVYDAGALRRTGTTIGAFANAINNANRNP